jgi:hypothetical protein
MKKLLVFLLILAAAGGLFAQDAASITWSGNVYTGLRFQAEDGDNARAEVYHDDAVGPQFNLYGAFTENNYGLQLGIIGDLDEGISVDDAWVWLKPLDVLEIRAGMGYGSLPNVYDWDKGGDSGVQFRLYPLDGLTLGMTLTVPSGDYAEHLNEYAIQETAFGVHYTSDVFKAHAVIKLDSEDDWTADSVSFDIFGLGAQKFSATKAEKEIAASAAVEITAIDSLTIDVGGNVVNLNDWASDGAGAATIIQKVGYQLNDAFNVYLLVTENLYSYNTSRTDGGWGKAPTGLHLEAGVGYVINPTYKFNFYLGANNWLLDGDTFGDDNEGFKNNTVWFEPALGITLGDHAAMTIYYKGTVGNTLKDVGVDERPFASLAQVNFGWSF